MQKLIAITVLIVSSGVVFAQKKLIEEIDQAITPHEVEAHLSFLAADEMRGRDTGSPELDLAANYIRTYFKVHNVKPAPGTLNYFQSVDLQKSLPPLKAQATLAQSNFVLKEDLLVLAGGSIQWNGEMVYVGYGSPEELAAHDINGKMVLALAGAKEADNINKIFMTSRDKHEAVIQRGAVGLVEILALPQVPWPALVNYFSQAHWGIAGDKPSVPHVWLKAGDVGNLAIKTTQTMPGSLSIESTDPQRIPGKNVAAFIPGSDATLRDQYVVITAHYDHVGVQKPKPQNGEDSIFNGARDNAIGTVALMQAAKFFAQHSPKRSVIFLAVTGEEKGLLGSQWYVGHPLVPLNKHVLNINCDGVGYNDKTRITSISLGRTNTDDNIVRAAKAFGFTVGGDPDPNENFYERSDQASFAKKGVPAVKIQPGLARMDDEIRKYYHRQADEVGSLDIQYLTTFYKTFVYAAYLLMNDPQMPSWKPGDKFEEVSKKLYGKP